MLVVGGGGVSQDKTSAKMVRTIRLCDDRVTEILNELDAAGTEWESANGGQRSPRYQYRIKALVVHMQQPGFSSAVPYLVPGRSISDEDLTFLHGGFVHPGTRCLVQLITSYGTWNNVNGSVTRCELVEGSIHEVVVRFDHAVDPEVYSPEAVSTRVLLVDDDPTIVRLVKFHLGKLNAVTDLAENGEEAIEMALRRPYDLILMDVEMPVMDGFEATKQLRERGYTGAIVAATALTKPEDAAHCLDMGCDKYLPKPFSRDGLSAILDSLRQEPLFSTFHDDVSMVPLVREFASELPTRIRLMEEAILNDDVETVKDLARSLKAGGTSYGFEVITEVADVIEKGVFNRAPLSELKLDVDKLSRLCFQVRAPQEVTPVDTDAADG